MNIAIRYDLTIGLNDTEVKQLLEALRYIRHRLKEHPNSGIYRASCKPEFIMQLIKDIENVSEKMR